MLKIKLFTVTISVLLLCLGCVKEGKNDLDELEISSPKPVQVNYQDRSLANSEISNSRHTAITKAVSMVSNAVCGINVTQIREYRRSNYYYDDPFMQFFFPERIYRRPVKSLGSGFLISQNGFILTNEHVIHNADEIVVVLPDGSTHKAEKVGEDFISDIALLKIDGDGFEYVRFGDSDDVIIGEWVIALGNPFGLFEINAKPTVTVGVVSAMDLDFGKQKSDRVYQDMIQTDAAINQGNSGGPLMNSMGEVIGMNTFIFTGSDRSGGSIGLGFAIPINRIRRVLKDLKEHGKIDRSWTTGIVVENISPYVADYFRLKTANGVIVTDVEKNSPADNAGLEIGDVILEVNDQKIRNRNDIWKIIENSDLRAGDEIWLKISRDGKDMKIHFKLKGI